jgi:3-oxoacyl-[acyl-carrier-protein] synthase II
MALALQDADVRAHQVDYINAHATSTPIGDTVEVRAIRHVFKRHADHVLINATKSMIGHTLGAAGAVAGVVCALSLQSGQTHPTLNYDNPDPACQLAGISGQSHSGPIHVALLNAFGFGSNNAAVVFKQFPT